MARFLNIVTAIGRAAKAGVNDGQNVMDWFDGMIDGQTTLINGQRMYYGSALISQDASFNTLYLKSQQSKRKDDIYYYDDNDQTYYSLRDGIDKGVIPSDISITNSEITSSRTLTIDGTVVRNDVYPSAKMSDYDAGRKSGDRIELPTVNEKWNSIKFHMRGAVTDTKISIEVKTGEPTIYGYENGIAVTAMDDIGTYETKEIYLVNMYERWAKADNGRTRNPYPMGEFLFGVTKQNTTDPYEMYFLSKNEFAIATLLHGKGNVINLFNSSIWHNLGEAWDEEGVSKKRITIRNFEGEGETAKVAEAGKMLSVLLDEVALAETEAGATKSAIVAEVFNHNALTHIVSDVVF